MKTSFLTTAILSLLLTLTLSGLLVTATASAFRKKYHPGGPINPAQGILLAGRILAGMILISGLSSALRDYLFISTGPNPIETGAFWSFLAICVCILSLSYLITTITATVLSLRIFKGQSIAVELQENNLAVAVVSAVITAALSFALLFATSVLMQSFIPVPAIPTIR